METDLLKQKKHLHEALQRITIATEKRVNQMIFLIDYDRKKGELRSFKRFRDDQRAEAQHERLDIELSLDGSVGSREVVLLEAHDEQALHRTHQRYSKTTQEILESMSAMVSAIPK